MLEQERDGEGMRDGDIYFWSWSVPESHSFGYHCWARKAIVKNGVLRDTYWHGSGEKELNLDIVNIEYQGNIHEMTEISKHEVDYYRPEDVVDMRHANSGRASIYVKPGASRDAKIMRKHIDYRIERAKGEIRSAESLIERLMEARAEIDVGNLDKVYL